jgi:hypothetical protein
MMSRARSKALLALLSLLIACPLVAGEVTPFLTDGHIGVRIRDVRFPASLRKELTSGLTNRVLIRVALLAEKHSIGQRAVEMAVKYDLWDENFHLTVMVDQRAVRDEVLPNVEQVLAFLHDTRLPDLFAPGDLTGAATFRLDTDVLLNPIDRERMDRVRKWVAENSAHAPIDPTQPDTSAPVGASMSNALFNSIFEQYASGTSVAAAWHETVASKPFTRESLEHDRQ